MVLHPCPECGHQISDRATACPDCGAPSAWPGLVVAQSSVEEWALSRLIAGSPRRQIVDELVGQGALGRREADALVKGLETATLSPADSRHRWMLVGAGGFATLMLILMLAFLFARTAGA